MSDEQQIPSLEEIALVYAGITASGYKIVVDTSNRQIGLTVEEVQGLFYVTDPPTP